MLPDDEKIRRLLDGYADGSLNPDELRALVDHLDSSPEAREELARGVVLERLMRTLGRPPVPSGQIMAAVAARATEGDAQAKPGRQPAPEQAGRSVRNGAGPFEPAARRGRGIARAAVALLCAAVVAFILAAVLRPKPAAEAPAPGATAPVLQPAKESAAPMQVHTEAAVERRMEKEGVATNAAAEPVALPVEMPPVIPPAVLRAFPLEPPPRPVDEDLSPPRGDGANEPGFVAPPAAWIAADRAQRAKSTSPDGQKSAEPPLFWVKVRPSLHPSGDATPDDLRSLLGAIKRQLGISAGMRDRAIDEIAADPSANPIVYLTGHYHFVLTPEQRTVLRRFMLGGGMLIFDPGLGSEPFYDSARRELRLIFPEIGIERLGQDHPLFHGYYDLERVTYGAGVRGAGYAENAPWFDGITISCRVAAVISRWGLGASWDGKAAEQFRAYRSEDALRLGINLFCYAAATRAWARRAASVELLPDQDATRSGKMRVAQVMYDGEWQTRYEALATLLHTFNRRTDVPVSLIVKPMRLTDPEIFNAPLLYMTGHQTISLSTQEAGKLGQYLRNGGFLFAEACCGRIGFDHSFRALMERVMPGQKLEPIPADATIFNVPNRIALVSVTPSLMAKKSTRIPPRLEGIRIGSGYGVVYSPYGMAGGWEMCQMPYADGYEDADALKLGQNILMYAVTQ